MKSRIVRRTGKEKAWTVSTGAVDPFVKASREAAVFITKLKGFVAVHPDANGTLWLFDSKESANAAKGQMTRKGIQTGNNICPCEIDYDKGTVTVYKDEEEMAKREEINDA